MAVNGKVVTSGGTPFHATVNDYGMLYKASERDGVDVGLKVMP